MIYPEILDSYTEEQQEILFGSLSNLHLLGLFEKQKNFEFEQILAGNNTEDPVELAKRIVDLRLRSTILSQLIELCQDSNRKISS